MRRVLTSVPRAFSLYALIAITCSVAPGAQPASTEAEIRAAFRRGTGVVQLRAGIIEILSELWIPPGAHDLEIRGSARGSTLRASPKFRGRAVIRVTSAARIRFENFAIDGNRSALERSAGLPPSNQPFCVFSKSNGLLAEDVEALTIRGIRFANVADFPILAARSRQVRIEGVRIENCGSRNEKGRNNASGGILLEEGTADFEVRNCVLRNVRGNGIWTHSLYTSPRNRDGVIAGNEFHELARDAIQVGHATNVRVENNRGSRIGYPAAEVDVENQATPAALDTAGDTDRSVYVNNRFEDVNGKCIDLDGFHHGEVRLNSCINRQPMEAYPNGHFGIVFNDSNPDVDCEEILVADNVIDGFRYGGIFVIGSNHQIIRNRLRNLNLARCGDGPPGPLCHYAPEEPDLLRSGIYLGDGVAWVSPAVNNVIRDNEIEGYGMRARCIGAAPGVSVRDNRIGPNECTGMR